MKKHKYSIQFCNFSHVIQPDKTEGMFQNQNLSGEQSTCIQAHLIYSSSSIAYTINSYTKSTLSRGVNLYMSLFLLLQYYYSVLFGQCILARVALQQKLLRVAGVQGLNPSPAIYFLCIYLLISAFLNVLQMAPWPSLFGQYK